MGEEKKVGWEEGGKTNTSSEILPKVTWRSYSPSLPPAMRTQADRQARPLALGDARGVITTEPGHSTPGPFRWGSSEGGLSKPDMVLPGELM